jgi:DinB superfamily/Pentapeptide repeats (8 copies)
VSVSPTFGRDDDLTGAVFDHARLRASSFHEANLSESTFYDATFQGATFRETYFGGARLIGVSFEGAVIDGDVDGLTINGVDVAPLVEAELDRRHPGRERLRSDDPDDLRAAWSWLEEQWAATTDEALSHPEADLRRRVEDEWSFLETLRHLVFATDSWLCVGVLGRTTYSPLGVVGPFLDPTTCGLDVSAEPSVEEVLAVRADRQALVHDYLATATSERLATPTVPPHGAGWPPSEAMTALARLHVILNEEWWHHQFARRDMASWPPLP